ncbi:hypothetical protein K491DRAFT_718569 [Lophiostoma macrostomum CBS 122681]|uniref:Alpha/beta-hydrolase n=1 Tax=Lophiostoma macrostomum CBS 122681 TaxID=1314788 RepID=A0A6A6SZ00_9PLEO|nr:hypothetical protein K491DRAFT_718569 [Lophiostoma macrostomum CBS 122681]
MWIHLGTALLLAFTSTTTAEDESRSLGPITLLESGGFNIGGKKISHPSFPNQTLSCDHGYLEYFIPWHQRKTNLVMWHSSSTQVWQNRWDGGPGFKDLFLRRDYPVWLWEGPRIGRANWGCENMTYQPSFFSDNANFAAWNLGPYYKQWWPGVQFPTDNDTAWRQATSNRYVEFDTAANVELHSDAAAIAADSGKIGTDIVYLTNSAGGLRAMMTTTKANGTNIKGIVAYESIGYVFPDNVNITAGNGGFGPFVVPLERFKKLAKVQGIQFIWGDHRPENSTFVQQSRLCASLINKYGGNAKVVKLAEDEGLTGSTHIAFADMDNGKVAGLLDGFLESNGLDGYQDDEEQKIK